MFSVTFYGIKLTIRNGISADIECTFFAFFIGLNINHVSVLICWHIAFLIIIDCYMIGCLSIGKFKILL